MKKTLFLADNHFEARPGYHLYQKLKERFDIDFHEDDWTVLDQLETVLNLDLLILNLIHGTGKAAPPTEQQASTVQRFLETGKPLLLLHGASAAFWPYPWWRRNVGLRWIRNNDPDDKPVSTHPVLEYRLCHSASEHLLKQRLREAELPEDEIYIKLYPEQAVEVLLETTIDEVTYPQAFLSRTTWGGRVATYLPGHRSEVVQDESTLHNVSELIRYLSS